MADYNYNELVERLAEDRRVASMSERADGLAVAVTSFYGTVKRSLSLKVDLSDMDSTEQFIRRWLGEKDVMSFGVVMARP